MKRMLILAALALASPAGAQQELLTPERCQQLNAAIASVGYPVVRLGALAEGYTEAQLRWAIAACKARGWK